MLGKKRGLGKGLDSLLSSSSSTRQKQVSYDVTAEKTQQLVDDVKGTLTALDVKSLQAGKYQPRREMDNNALEELANSIRAQGIIQPIVVRETGHQKYEIIAGERRWRAAKLVGLEEIPCLIKNVEDNAAIAIALIENIQRENLNAMEEAIALKRLLEEFNLTHVEVAQAVGKSRTTISNLLRLNNLNDDVKVLLEQGDIEMGHARALLSCSEDLQLGLAKIVMAKSLTVRKTELLVKNTLTPQPVKVPAPPCEKADHIIKTFQHKLGLSVTAKTGKKDSGQLVINYSSLDDLEELMRKIDLEQ
ncbi:ParB/RepB/Spo0J family partition protein [Psychromonas sp.]|uniref:ParB/RepB/Spo0J family partition protein n=1 Tax=Psychromonas sp. TaxID=1884585 RepID=UPI0035621E11